MNRLTASQARSQLFGILNGSTPVEVTKKGAAIARIVPLAAETYEIRRSSDGAFEIWDQAADEPVALLVTENL